MMKELIKAIFFVVNILLISNLLLADTKVESKQIAEEVYQEFLSPFCPGRALSDCPSSKAEDLKKKILVDLDQGQTKETVIRNLETEFGSELNAKPKFSGFAGLAWFIPITFMLVLALIGYRWVRNARTKGDES